MINSYDNETLLLKLKDLVKEEKRLTQEVLDHLAEVEARRLYALRGYPSLFEFCVKELGYSESSAHRRISAMRVMKTLPEAKEKFEEGSVNLSTLTQLHGFIKKEERANQEKLPMESKRALLTTIENKSQNECAKEFAKISPETVKVQEAQRPLSEELTQIKFVATRELVAKLETLKNLMGNKNIETYAELFNELADMALKKYRVRQPASMHENVSTLNYQPKSTFAAEVRFDTGRYDRYIPSPIKKQIWHRDQGHCQFIDPVTKRKCGSRYALQIDHVVPLAKGGTGSPANLRLLCRTHNQTEAMRILGKEKMSKLRNIF